VAGHHTVDKCSIAADMSSFVKLLSDKDRAPSLKMQFRTVLRNDQIQTKFGMVTHMGKGVFLGGQPRHCICTNASRSLSAMAEFLVCINRPQLSFNSTTFTWLTKPSLPMSEH